MKTLIRNKTKQIKGILAYYLIKYGIRKDDRGKLNLGSGRVLLKGFWNIDTVPEADIVMDLENKLLPFQDNSLDTVVCISAIDYFSRNRGLKIIKDVYRVLKINGVARFGTKDLRLIAGKYLNNDKEFFFQKLPNGKERFEGATIGDKFNSWFYGYKTYKNKRCKYFYDFESLAQLFHEAGFRNVSQKKYGESLIPNVQLIDNRQEQMFFLEAVK